MPGCQVVIPWSVFPKLGPVDSCHAVSLSLLMTVAVQTQSDSAISDMSRRSHSTGDDVHRSDIWLTHSPSPMASCDGAPDPMFFRSELCETSGPPANDAYVESVLA